MRQSPRPPSHTGGDETEPAHPCPFAQGSTAALTLVSSDLQSILCFPVIMSDGSVSAVLQVLACMHAYVCMHAI